VLEIRQREHPLHGWKEVSPLPYLTEPPVIPVIHRVAAIADMVSKEEDRLLQLDVSIRCECCISHEHPKGSLINIGNHFPANLRPVSSHRYNPSQRKAQMAVGATYAPEVAGLGKWDSRVWHCKRKGHLVRYFIKRQGKMLSVHNQDAEEILDARVIQNPFQTCKSASSGTERKDQIRVLQTKTCEILSTWTQTPDSSKSAPDGTKRGTERKDQIRVLQTASRDLHN